MTTGPALLFELDDGARPGDVTAPGRRGWQARLASTADVDVVEVIVNGQVVETASGVQAGETRQLRGELTLPEGGWVAIRAYSAERQEDAWPTMHARPFAHSSPIWINRVGSTEQDARVRAAGDLLRAVEASIEAFDDAYGEVPTPRLDARLDAARGVLVQMRNPAPATTDGP